MISALGLYILLPDYRSYLLREDSLVENISVLLFLISFFVGLYISQKSKTNRKVPIILSAVSLLGFLDEISFGERLFHLDMPVIRGVKIDAAHDIFYLVFKEILIVSSAHRYYAVLVILISLLIATLLLLKYRSNLLKIYNYITSAPPLILAMFFVLLVFLALIIDLHILRSPVLFMLEELFEMNAALALLICGLSLHGRQFTT
jgi:hypothetical protein